MIRRFLLIGLILLNVICGIGVYTTSEAVLDLRSLLTETRLETANEQDRYNVLTAEWAYLNAPSRLETLAQKLLPEMKPAAGVQLARGYETIPNYMFPLTDAEDILVAGAAH